MNLPNQIPTRERSTVSDYIAWTVVAAFAILIALLMQQSAYVVFGNLHDLFIPLNAAYAVENGLRLHSDFHSPFGLYFHATNQAGFTIVQHWPDQFHLLDMIMFTSVITALVFSILFFAVRQTQPGGMRLTSWSFVALFTLLFQVRNASAIWDHTPLWYAIYNHQGWALLLLQVVHVFVFSLSEKNPNNTALFGALQAIFLLLALHFKISFFAASGLAFFAALFQMQFRLALIYISSSLGVVIAALLTIAAFGYDYLGFIMDNLAAIWARSSGLADSVSMRTSLLGFFLFVVAVQVLRFHERITIAPQKSIVRLIIVYWKYGIWPHVTARQLTFDSLLALAILAAAAGDYRRPWIYFALALWMLPFQKTSPVIRRAYLPLFLAVLAALFNFKNVTSSVLLLGGKYWQAEHTAQNNFRPIQEVAFHSTFGRVPLIIRNGASIEIFLKESLFAKAPGWTEAMFEHAYTLVPESQREKWLPAGNAQYVSDVNQVTDFLRMIGLERREDVFIEALTFTNPYPFLLQTPLPKGSFNWLHFGTTLAPDKTSELLAKLSEAEIVLLPVRDELQVEDRVYLNCKFLLWNAKRAKPFTPVALLGRILVFASPGIVDLHSLDPLHSVDETKVSDTCSDAPFDPVLKTTLGDI